MSWRLHVLTLQIRKSLSYRTDFWVSFLGSIGVHVGVAYFLWKSVFEFNNIEQLAGYNFSSLMFYYFLVPFIGRITLSDDETGIAREIYDGSFSKYLLYPVDVVTYQFMEHIGHALVTILQLIVGLTVALFIFGLPENFHLSVVNFALFVPIIFVSAYIVFIMMFTIELFAFWADTVWSLVVMLRLVIGLFGGQHIPVEMFPESLRRLNDIFPFQFAGSVPIRCLIGKLTMEQSLYYLTLGVFWSCSITLVAFWVLRRGLKSYTGVGI